MSLKDIPHGKVVLIVVVTLGSLIWVNVDNTDLGTGNLLPYRSEAGGFAVHYPMDWSVLAENQGNSLVVAFQSPSVRDDEVFQSASVIHHKHEQFL